ncbi:hypothetical protein V1279_003098 [Bradyrhizobium sp. AZCC 1610]|uniref:hypothetical protein n=1 Tax=Bradyrhizobium sp. AZCC 1610 TaxID=3117020 RepID=UPI002FF426CD
MRWHDRILPRDECELRFGVKPKHCPFCASFAVGLYLGPTPHITCVDCNADGPQISEGRREDLDYRQYQAILKWNMRV